jgi:hypothetical protein
LVDTDMDGEFRLLAINVTGTVHMAKRVVQHMGREQNGQILIVSSISATTHTPYACTGRRRHRQQLSRQRGHVQNEHRPPCQNDKTLVARQGNEALFAGHDHVVGGDEPPNRPSSTTAPSLSPAEPPDRPNSLDPTPKPRQRTAIDNRTPDDQVTTEANRPVAWIAGYGRVQQRRTATYSTQPLRDHSEVASGQRIKA